MNNAISVTQLNKYIKQLLSKDVILSDVLVSGEISNFKHHSSGHMYFTLKDNSSLIKCVMFYSYNTNLKFMPEDGMKVIVRGNISVYEASGLYQLYPTHMIPDGVGNLFIAYEQLKKKLSDEGLFDDRYKKEIPLVPKTIGIITSKTGSVIRDIINVSRRRFPNVSLKLLPVAVQGDSAAKQISSAIRTFNALNNVDVIIIARGGGSLEELWPFNEEVVARSIFESVIPIISAVGHETDFSISDFVADLRAPTPSAAAELAVPEIMSMTSQLDNYKIRSRNAVLKKIAEIRHKREALMQNKYMKNPLDIVNQKRIYIDSKINELEFLIKRNFDKKRNSYELITQKLIALNPLIIMSRGYGYVTNEEDKPIKSVKDIQLEEIAKINLCDGIIKCVVINKEKN